MCQRRGDLVVFFFFIFYDNVMVFLFSFYQLRVIQCMDVVEQLLIVLEMLFRRYGKFILQVVSLQLYFNCNIQSYLYIVVIKIFDMIIILCYDFQGGIVVFLMFLDFFSITVQRSVLVIIANCVQNMTYDEFYLIRDSLQLLSNKFIYQVRIEVYIIIYLFFYKIGKGQFCNKIVICFV